jgi:Fic family protein
MDLKAFTNAGAGSCQYLKDKDYWAFLPRPLPPRLEPSWELTNALSEADRALSELAGVGRLLTNPHLLIQPAIRREAVLSSRIEGTQASMSDLLFFEAGASEGQQPEDVHEVANYVGALEYGLQRLDTLPLSGRLFREIHEKLMRGVRGDHADPGEFRRTQNWIGPAGCTLNQAAYVPPPVEAMHQALADFEKYLHKPQAEPPLIRCALMHYQFEAIHPFIDGNGRVGRLLVPLYLCSQGLLSQPLLYLSAYFEKNRTLYYDHLLAVSQKGAWDAWLHFFLAGVVEQSKESLETTKKLLALREQIKASVAGKRVPTAVGQLVDHLFGNPIVSPARLAKQWELSYPAVAKGIQILVKKKWLRESTGRRRGRVFVCDTILSLVNPKS